jgi:hypothetical protein
MAITNAQQFKQLVNPPMEGKKRPGYRGDAAGHGTGDPGESDGPGAGGGNTGGNGQDNRDRFMGEMGKTRPGRNPMAQFGGGKPPPAYDEFGPPSTTNFNFMDQARKTVNPFGFLTELPGLYGMGFRALTPNPFGFSSTGPTTPVGGGSGGDEQQLPTWAQLGFNSEAEYLASLEDEEDKDKEEDEGLRLAFRADGGRAGLAEGGMPYEGGIMDLESARQMYGLGKLVKKVTRSVKKIAKSPIGKAAIGYALTGGLSNMAAGRSFGANFFSPSSFISKGGIRNIFTKEGLSNIAFGAPGKYLGSPRGPNTGILTKGTSGLFGSGGELSPLKAIAGVSALSGLLTAEQEEEAQALSDNTGFSIEEARNSILARARDDYKMDFRARGFRAEGGIMRTNYANGSEDAKEEEAPDLSNDPNYKGWVKVYEASPEAAEMNENHSKYLQFYNRKAEGGSMDEPVAKKTMPLLDMGGKEMDLRAEGGFVPIGRMEKADDVPARLSKNEFVFTADAVRNAGDGNVDKGAEVMYNMMKNLESGGDVSEESQGLEGARKMFQTSQRLEEVL